MLRNHPHEIRKRLRRIQITAFILFLFPLTSFGKGITTPQIVTETIKAIPSCFHYKVIGVCYWWVCNGLDCHVETTPKVEHYLPDAVVTVFRKVNSNPWDYAGKIIDPIAHQAGQVQVKTTMGFTLGEGNQSVSGSEEQNNHLKEVDVIGNPTLGVFSSKTKMLLPSQARALIPYYVSLGDAYMWRSSLIEATRYAPYLVPGVHIVGSLINNWGAIYPRVGFINQPADGKAAAVIAQRAADIVTRGEQPHIYKALNTNNSCGDHCQTWEAVENDKNTQWQMIYPIVEHQCIVFGENDLTSPQAWGTEAAQKGDGNYAWVMWRHYKGCVPNKNGRYIGSTNF